MYRILQSGAEHNLTPFRNAMIMLLDTRKGSLEMGRKETAVLRSVLLILPSLQLTTLPCVLMASIPDKVHCQRELTKQLRTLAACPVTSDYPYAGEGLAGGGNYIILMSKESRGFLGECCRYRQCGMSHSGEVREGCVVFSLFADSHNHSGYCTLKYI